MELVTFDSVYLKNGKQVTYLGMQEGVAEVGWMEGSEYHRMWVSPETIYISRLATLL